MLRKTNYVIVVFVIVIALLLGFLFLQIFKGNGAKENLSVVFNKIDKSASKSGELLRKYRVESWIPEKSYLTVLDTNGNEINYYIDISKTNIIIETRNISDVIKITDERWNYSFCKGDKVSVVYDRLGEGKYSLKEIKNTGEGNCIQK